MSDSPNILKSEKSGGQPPFVSWRQGGIRYADNIDEKGETLTLDFTGKALYADGIWRQLYGGIKLKPIACEEIFGNSNPLNLEIGIGNGEFIANFAASVPSENWLGAEVFKKVFKAAEKRANRVPHDNIRVIQFDAALILRLMVDNSLKNIYVNFPDPWPKKRHNRRRLLKTDFLKLASSKLERGGLLQIATDHSGYAAEIEENLKDVSGLRSIYETAYARDIDGYFPTKYYRKFAADGGAYFFRYEKI